MNATNFREAIGSFDKAFGLIEGQEARLLDEVKRFEHRLDELAATESSADLSDGHELTRLVEQLKSVIKDAISHWTQRFADAAPVRGLSKKYEDRAILLVFGKVNAGKSTFVNFLTDELQRAGASMRRFAIEDGEEVEVATGFAVGTTETTACIQGVEVDNRLVLLDSPGLHSVTKDNHERTKLYTDSADVVVWLSSSTSPGQVQELQDLKAELEQKKPLLPVITKSDWRDEYWCDATGGPSWEIRNKSRKQRKEQEDDVLSRTRQLGLDVGIRPVSSISIRCYENAGRSDLARTEAGLDTLYELLVGIIDDAESYKVGKAEQVARNFVDGQVLPEIERCVAPTLDDLIERSRKIVHQLGSATRQQLKDEVESEVTAEIVRIVDLHKDTENKQAIVDELATFLTSKLAESVRKEVARYLRTVATAMVPLVQLSSNELDDFENISTEFKQKTGAALRSVLGSIGSGAGWAGGVALGTFASPILGTAIGGTIGASAGLFMGDQIGKLFSRAESRQVSEVSPEALKKSAVEAIKPKITKYVDSATDALIETIKSTAAFARNVRSEIDQFKKEIGRTS